jgi:hypothetical protein
VKLICILSSGAYDARVLCESGEVPDRVADKVVEAIQRLNADGSAYTSTRSAGSSTLRFVPTHVSCMSLQLLLLFDKNKKFIKSVTWRNLLIVTCCVTRRVNVLNNAYQIFED